MIGNSLQIANMIAQIEDLEKIIVIGSNMDSLPFMQMAEVNFQIPNSLD
jgi:hypothetical protein